MSHLDVPPDQYWPDRPISFAPAFAVLRRYWQFVLGSIVVGGVLAASFAAAVPKFGASGFYYTPGWSLAEYKRFSTEFGSSDALRAYFADAHAGNTDAASLLIDRSEDPLFWERSVKPLFPITKRDAREIFEPTKDKDASTIIGLELKVPGRHAGIARDAVVTLGEYLTQTLLKTKLQAWISSGQSASNGELLKAEIQVLQTRYSLGQARQRIEELRSLQTKYPETQRMETRQVVSADAASARYLAPIAQVIALESSVAEMNESLRRWERRARQLAYEVAFFDKAASTSRSVRRGLVLLDQLESAHADVFKGMESDDEAIREVANRFALDLKAFADQFSIAFGFRSPVLEPTLSSRSIARFALVGMVLGFFSGFGLAGFYNWRQQSASARMPASAGMPSSPVLRAAE